MKKILFKKNKQKCFCVVSSSSSFSLPSCRDSPVRQWYQAGAAARLRGASLCRSQTYCAPGLFRHRHLFSFLLVG